MCKTFNSIINFYIFFSINLSIHWIFVKCRKDCKLMHNTYIMIYTHEYMQLLKKMWKRKKRTMLEWCINYWTTSAFEYYSCNVQDIIFRRTLIVFSFSFQLREIKRDKEMFKRAVEIPWSSSMREASREIINSRNILSRQDIIFKDFFITIVFILILWKEINTLNNCKATWYFVSFSCFAYFT